VATFACRPDLLLTEVIGKAPITCREVAMENWRMTALLDRFEETQKYLHLYKGKSVSLLLRML